MIGQLLSMLFGGQRNVVRDVAEVFVPNAEAQAGRAHQIDSAALAQFAAEFGHARKGWFDRFVDALNRLPRPLTVLGVVWMLVGTARYPDEMAVFYAALATVPEPLWVVIGLVVTFYFGGRAQVKDIQFQQGIAAGLARAQALQVQPVSPPDSETTLQAPEAENPALAEILARRPETREDPS